MNEVKKGAMKTMLVTFTLTLIATVVGGIIVEKFVRSTDAKAALAQNTTAQPPRQVVTTTLPADEVATV